MHLLRRLHARMRDGYMSRDIHPATKNRTVRDVLELIVHLHDLHGYVPTEALDEAKAALAVSETLPSKPTPEMAAAWRSAFDGGETFNGCYEAMLRAIPSARVSTWIPISERLPEREKWVLVHNGKWTGVGAYMYEEDDSECWQDERTEFIEHLGPKVTHWMPLPEAPNVK